MKKAILTVRIPSDDLATQGPGTWVEFRTKLKMKQYVALKRVAAIGKVTEPDEIDAAFKLICETLAQIVVDWNWTDEEGEPLPRPKDNIVAFEDMDFEELMWLVEAMGEHAGKQGPSKKK